ncbi:cytochrome b/b6 domain-containing protein [Variovorax sp. KK3]|uniref:cytochrome b/b6 domain-containing protein n=1 Tax=Variovorax sp. KK3 TaxID=1855728 RepID=UPI00097C6999|nr:cytochrome b/b6 domain-containing protein [Variovorax sp. KK3]
MPDATTPLVREAGGTVRVWDPLQRVLHWALVTLVCVCWWAGEARLSLHIATGYAVLAIVTTRGAWGFVGSRHARFVTFVRGMGPGLGYARDMLLGREHRYLGHNPLGGWMVLALLACLAIVCVSGVLYTTDRFWGLEWVEQTHRISAWTLVGLVAAHLCGVAAMSWRHRENLVGAMFTGRKRAARDRPPGA